MSMTTPNDARINFRLPKDVKQIIEQAAASTGQTVSEFSTSSILEKAQEVLLRTERTYLSNRDRDRFIKALEKTDAEPNEALKAAAKKYRKRLGK